jgi:hypothetical protein
VRGRGERGFDRFLITDFRFPGEIPRYLVRQLWGAVFECTFGVGDAFQVAVLDLDQLGRILCRRSAVRDDECDRFPDETHALVREHRALGRTCFHAVLADESHRVWRARVAGTHRVFAGKYVLHPRERERALRVHREDFRVRAVSPHEVAVELARCVPVGRISTCACDEADVFDAPAIVMVVLGIGTHRLFPPAIQI